VLSGHYSCIPGWTRLVPEETCAAYIFVTDADNVSVKDRRVLFHDQMVFRVHVKIHILGTASIINSRCCALPSMAAVTTHYCVVLAVKAASLSAINCFLIPLPSAASILSCTSHCFSSAVK
jgi:hypothetical protein